jgi:hypothetical protein
MAAGGRSLSFDAPIRVTVHAGQGARTLAEGGTALKRDGVQMGGRGATR